MSVGNPSKTAWLDRAFDTHWGRSPVDATFVGVSGHDHRLPDMSEHGLGDAVAGIRTSLSAEAATNGDVSPAPDASMGATAGPDAGHPPAFWSTLDRRLMRGFLAIQDWEYGSRHFQWGNPSLYTGEAVFGVMGLFLADFAPLDQRVEWAVARMESVPAFLRQAAANVSGAPSAWTDRAIRECRGALAFLTEGLDLLAAGQGITDPGFRAAGDRAARAFAEYQGHLQGGLAISDHYACGEQALAMYLSQGHCLDRTPEQVAMYAEDALERADANLAEACLDRKVIDPDEALDMLRDLHPAPEGYDGAYQRAWDRIWELNRDRDLLTWPDFPIRYVPRPEWTRRAAPDLYFLFYRSPSAFRRPPVHDYLVLPVDDSLSPEQQVERLRSTNDSVILLNHVVHHGGIGHHVQNWHAFRSRSRVGQVAAVDCASRIAMFCGGTMAEGWACYATDLIREVGGLTGLQVLSELQSRRRMCARAIVDVRLHQGRMTLEQGAAFYRARAGMSEAAARNEATKNSMFPGAAVMYLMGTDRIHALRDEIARLQGDRFSLRAFHDEFLSFGSVPVTLIAEEMERRHAAPQ